MSFDHRYGPSADEYEDTVREFERDMSKMDDRLADVEAAIQRRNSVAFNPQAFVKVQDFNMLCDDVDELRGIVERQGRLLKALLASVGELNDKLDEAPAA